MTSPGCVIVAHTRTFNEVYSVIGTSRKYTDFEPPKKIGKQTEREREKVLCLLRMRKSSREKRRREEGEEEREDEAIVLL